MFEILKKLFPWKKKPVINEPIPVERQPETKPPTSKKDEEWIGVDLDGTLARNDVWLGHSHIGDPVPVMMARVRFWLDVGLTVKIFTARACDPDAIEPIKQWMAKHGLPELEITNAKDFNMIECWDDRAVQVVQNTGRPFLSSSIIGRPRVPMLPQEVPTQTFYPAPPKFQEN
ncbi:MAG: hypothetical protein LBV54_01860 [Puniceicoccales bacterium]|jgi:hypothetical protein|nr:hypothetical protein [Puniceicoccales bacterium]